MGIIRSWAENIAPWGSPFTALSQTLVGIIGGTLMIITFAYICIKYDKNNAWIIIIINLIISILSNLTWITFYQNYDELIINPKNATVQEQVMGDWGFRLVLLYSLLAFIAFGFLYIISKIKKKRKFKSEEERK
jgi:hypothetical protein